MLEARLNELASRFGLDAEATTKLALLLEQLAADEHAPTPIRDPAEAVDRHVADSLVALELDEVRAARTIADLGSGAGYPALALAAALPGAQVHAVEAAGRKARSIEAAAEAAGLGNVTVHATRAEAFDGAPCDLVVARAVAALPVLVEYAAPILALGGHLVAWKGAPEPEEAAAGERAAAIVGLEPLEPRAVVPFRATKDRRLYRYVKTQPTPATYPRRPGMAVKRPLG